MLAIYFSIIRNYVLSVFSQRKYTFYLQNMLLDEFRTNSRNIIGRNPSMVIPMLANQDLTPMLHRVSVAGLPLRAHLSTCMFLHRGRFQFSDALLERRYLAYIVFVILTQQFGVWGLTPRKIFMNQAVYNVGKCPSQDRRVGVRGTSCLPYPPPLA